MSHIVVCPSCSQKNRLPVEPSGRPLCGRCRASLLRQTTPVVHSSRGGTRQLVQLQREDRHRDWSRLQTRVSYLLVDSSGSMTGGKILQAQKGATQYGEQAIVNEYAVGLITFA